MKALDTPAAIFDMDGTLVDSMPYWNRLCKDLLDEHNIPFEQIAHIIGDLSISQCADYVHQQVLPQLSQEEILARWDAQMLDHYKNDVPAKPYAVEYVQFLARKGVKMCIASLSEVHFAKAALSAHNIYQYFNFVITVSQVGHDKSKPNIYLEAARRLGFSPDQCTVYEDAYLGCKAAHFAGFFVVGLADDQYSQYAKRMPHVCDLFVPSFSKTLPDNPLNA